MAETATVAVEVAARLAGIVAERRLSEMVTSVANCLADIGLTSFL